MTEPAIVVTIEETRSSLAIAIRNVSRAPVAVLHPEGPPALRAFTRVDGGALRITKVTAQVPEGVHVNALPAPFVFVLGPGEALAEHLTLAEAVEYDPMYAASFHLHHPPGTGRVVLGRPRVVEAAEVVVEHVALAPDREIRRVGNDSLLFPGIARTEIARAGASLRLSAPLTVLGYTWRDERPRS
jgi:hypothetical protein